MKYVVKFKVIKVWDDGYWVIEHVGTPYEDAIGPYASYDQARSEEIGKLQYLGMDFEELVD